MASKIAILVVEDQLEVLNAIVHDIKELEDTFIIEEASSVKEARLIIDELIQEESKIGLILCDCVMPDAKGTVLLEEMQQQPATQPTRKILITGMAELQDTIQAVNKANLNHYIAKPWDKDELVKIVKHELTNFVIKEEENLLPYMSILNTERIMSELEKRGHTGEY